MPVPSNQRDDQEELADPDLDDWISKNLVGVSGRKRERLLQTEKDRRAAVERADQAEAEARRLRRQNRQLEARPSTSLEIGGQQLGPLGTTAAGVAVFLAGVGVGVGVE